MLCTRMIRVSSAEGLDRIRTFGTGPPGRNTVAKRSPNEVHNVLVRSICKTGDALTVTDLVSALQALGYLGLALFPVLRGESGNAQCAWPQQTHLPHKRQVRVPCVMGTKFDGW